MRVECDSQDAMLAGSELDPGLTMRATILAFGLVCILLHSAAAQSPNEMRVTRLAHNGVAVDEISDPVLLVVRPPIGSPTHRLAVKDPVSAGTRIETGAGVTLVLKRELPRLEISMEAGTRLTVLQNSENAARAEVDQGRAGFSLLGRLDFYFGVGSFQRVFAVAKGTLFDVSATPSCVDAAGSPCVSIALREGRLELETRRAVLIDGTDQSTDATMAGLRAPSSGEDETVGVFESMTAGNQRTFLLDPSRFALRFNNWAEANNHFAVELESARATNDPRILVRALRNSSVILRLGDQAAKAAELSAEGLRIASAVDDRLWEFRFLIDLGFETWQQNRDRSALAYFERAFDMTDVTDSLLPRADLAALYGRYGGIRFDARDRAKPAADVDAAESFMQRALALRMSAADGRPTLDLAWSHFGLGVLLRIARGDYAEADMHLTRAVALRREILDSRDDIVTAQMLADEALGKEQLAYRRFKDLTISRDEFATDMMQVHAIFEESLGMLSRLFPGGENRSIGAVARRMADFQMRLGDWLGEQGMREEAQIEYQSARSNYKHALTSFANVSGNVSAEQRFAYLGLGKTELLLGQPKEALATLARANELAMRERCASAPEAPSPTWVEDLLRRLATAAELNGDLSAAAAYIRQVGPPLTLPACGDAEAPR